MAEEERFEVAAINSWYKRMQMDSQARFTNAVEGLGGQYKNRLSEAPAGNVADTMGKQASSLEGAGEILGSIERQGRYDSRGAHAAAIERGIQDKMKAMNMLGKVREQGDAQATPMMAEFVDVLTGDVVNAEQFLTPGATQNISGRNEIDARLRDAAGGPNEFTSLFTDHMSGTKPKDSFWNAAFGDIGGDMKSSYEAGNIDFDNMYREMSGALRGANNTGERTARESLFAEQSMRAEAAQAQKESFQMQEGLAQQKVDALSAEAARGQQEIKQSIIKDKQSLARQSHGEINDGAKKKARIDYNAGGSRPV